jgi:hypothetical protein
MSSRWESETEHPQGMGGLCRRGKVIEPKQRQKDVSVDTGANNVQTVLTVREGFWLRTRLQDLGFKT